jgi:hypothetical protein
MTTWYVIDTRINEIVNACEADVEPDLGGFMEPEHLRLDPNPPLAMLQRYRYWEERP